MPTSQEEKRLIPAAAAWPTKSCSCHIKQTNKQTTYISRQTTGTQNGELL